MLPSCSYLPVGGTKYPDGSQLRKCSRGRRGYSRALSNFSWPWRRCWHGIGRHCAPCELGYRDVLDCRRIAAPVFGRRDLAPVVYVAFKNTDQNVRSRRLDFSIRAELKAAEYRAGGGVGGKSEAWRRSPGRKIG